MYCLGTIVALNNPREAAVLRAIDYALTALQPVAACPVFGAAIRRIIRTLQTIQTQVKGTLNGN